MKIEGAISVKAAIEGKKRKTREQNPSKKRINQKEKRQKERINQKKKKKRKKNFSSEVAQNALLFIEYPIKVSDLTAIIDKALAINKELEAEKKEEQIKEALKLAEAEKKKSFIRKIFEKF